MEASIQSTHPNPLSHPHQHPHDNQQTVVLEQELPLSDLLGIAVGHLYHYAATRKLLRPPGFLKQVR